MFCVCICIIEGVIGNICDGSRGGNGGSYGCERGDTLKQVECSVTVFVSWKV